MTLSLVLVLLVAHFTGDFLCQSDWMALNKSKRLDALFFHVWVYMGVLAFFVAAAHGWQRGSVPNIVTWLAVNMTAHFVQDAITSRITSRLWFIELGDARSSNRKTLAVHQCGSIDYRKRHWFFVAIGADQLLHTAVLMVTAQWWLR